MNQDSWEHPDLFHLRPAGKMRIISVEKTRELISDLSRTSNQGGGKVALIHEADRMRKESANAFLKTLEEPPPSLKFILATTEVRKIPVTILSRCQRFDLKRVSVGELCEHLRMIADKEKGNITDDAIQLIARTSEGSVRDSISLLDRALISQSVIKNKIEEPDVRQMLGLADKSKIISLLKEVLSGNEKDAMKILHELINDGLDAKNFLNDILEALYLFSRRINLGPIEKDMSISEAEVQMVDQYSKNLDMQDIGLFWQLTIKTIDDLRIVGNENLTLEMYIMQLIHLKKIETRKENINLESNKFDSSNENLVGKKIDEKNIENSIPNQVKNQLKNTDQIKNNPIKSFLKESDDHFNIMVGFNRRFAPLIKKVKLLIDGINQPKFITYNINAGYLNDDHWLCDRLKGGGRLIGEVCHFIDTCTYLTGSIPESVHATCVTKPDQSIPDEDNVSIVVKYKNGSTAVINYYAYGNNQLSKEYIELFAPDIAMRMDNFRTLEIFKGAKSSKFKNANQDKGFKGEFKSLVSAVKNGDLAISFEELYTTSKVTFAVLESLKSGELQKL